MLPAKIEVARQVARKKNNPATLVLLQAKYIHKTVAGFCRKNCVWRTSAVSNVWVAGNF